MVRDDGASSSRRVRRSTRSVSRGQGPTLESEANEFRRFLLTYTDGRRDLIRFLGAFTESSGSLIDQYVCLNTNDGCNWVVHVEKQSGNIWISDSLKRFKERYNIQALDTLYFKHKKEDQLKVVMFSANGLQYGWGREEPAEMPVSFLKKLVKQDYSTKLVENQN